MGFPNCTLSFAYRMDSSRAAWSMPTAWAAIPMRPWSNPVMAMGSPAPSFPSRFSAGTRHCLNTTSEVWDERIPILSKCLPGTSPGVPFGTMKALMPLRPADRSVQQNRMYVSARGPLETKVFVPSIT